MSDKTLFEVNVVETDEGFRIEVKGDKERLRAMGFGQGTFPFGFGGGHGPFGGHHGPRGFGFRGGWHHGRGPWGRGPWGHRPWWADDEPETSANREAPAADKV